MKILSIANQKGGPGKTTVAINLGYELSQSKRVLFIDMDSQCNLTSFFNSQYAQCENNIYSLLNKTTGIKKCIVNVTKNLSFVPGSPLIQYFNTQNATILKKGLAVLTSFDYVIIDNPPAINDITLNSFTASQSILIITDTEMFSLDGIDKLIENVDLINQTHNPSLSVAGIIINKMNDRRNLCRAAARDLRAKYPDLVLDAQLNNYSELSLALHRGMAVGEAFPKSKSAAQMLLLADEVSRRV